MKAGKFISKINNKTTYHKGYILWCSYYFIGEKYVQIIFNNHKNIHKATEEHHHIYLCKKCPKLGIIRGIIPIE